MPWVKKAAAPDYLNAVARLRVAMTGTVDDWLLPWINLVDWGTALDVNAFCAAGPPDPATFDENDFLPAMVGGPIGAAVAIWGLRDKVNRRAAEILFADLCQQETSGGTHCVLLEESREPSNTTHPWGPFIPWPAAATSLRVTVTQVHTSGTPDLHAQWYNGATNLGETSSGAGNMDTLGEVQNYPRPAGATDLFLWSNSVNMKVKVEGCGVPGTITPFVPPAITQPDTAIPPEAGVYTTIADLGAELDAIEQKLHWVLNYTSMQLVDRINPLVADDVITLEEEDEDIVLGPNVMGFIVTLTSIPGSADERFGEPIQLHNLGRVVMGNGDAWLPPINLTVTPMLILKPDPTITVARVHTYPPTGATIHTLIRPDPAG